MEPNHLNGQSICVYVIRQGPSEINIPFLYTYNDKQHQSSGGECGVYCLHFLTYMS